MQLSAKMLQLQMHSSLKCKVKRMADLHLENSSWLSYDEIAAWPTYSSISLGSTLLSVTFWCRNTKDSTQNTGSNIHATHPPASQSCQA